MCIVHVEWTGSFVQAKLHSRAFDDLYFECFFLFIRSFVCRLRELYLTRKVTNAYRKLEILHWTFHTKKFEFSAIPNGGFRRSNMNFDVDNVN